jgi:tRNA (guanosine-2'-O-)-methyltransferase
MDDVTKDKLFAHLSQYVSSHKQELIEKILDLRTRKITIVLENILQSQNASAVVRTCECLGVQDFYTIEDFNEYWEHKDVLKGSIEWVRAHRCNTPGGGNAVS